MCLTQFPCLTLNGDILARWVFVLGVSRFGSVTKITRFATELPTIAVHQAASLTLINKMRYLAKRIDLVAIQV